MTSPRRTRLWVSIARPFFLFVVAGSIVLVLWIQWAARRESRAVFTALARTNAGFLRTAHLPATAQMMDYMGELLNMKAFLRNGTTLVPEPEGALAGSAPGLLNLRDGHGVAPVGNGYEAVATEVAGGQDLVLVRPGEPAPFWRPETLLVLGIFWLASVGLAWPIARGVVKPIELLANRLPNIENDPGATLPGAERGDEVGELARAYLAAREQIATERTKRQQAERMALLGRMATSLAHEIHNPLSAIRMHAQLLNLLNPAQMPPGTEDFIPTLLAETARIESLVNQWMFLAKPEPPAMAVLSLEQLVSQCVKAHSPAAAHAGVTVETDIAPGLTITGDRRRLGQAVTNALVNATQAMPRGGLIEISARQRGGEIALVFRDHGTGFSAEALARYRELFFTEKEGGMGIGLSVTGEILEAHRGRLGVANAAEGGGAEVTFYLPAEASV